MDSKLKIDKLDAVAGQLDTAIRLFFADGDPVSIHTLTAAAYNLTRDICSHRGAGPMLIKDTILTRVRDEHKTTVSRKMNEAENFFKHADRDPEEQLEFHPGLSKLMLYDCCLKYHELSGEYTAPMQAICVFMTFEHPEMFTLPPEAEAARAYASETFKALSVSKREFLALIEAATTPQQASGSDQ